MCFLVKDIDLQRRHRAEWVRGSFFLHLHRFSSIYIYLGPFAGSFVLSFHDFLNEYICLYLAGMWCISCNLYLGKISFDTLT